MLIGVYCVTLVGGWVLGYIGKVATGSLQGLDHAAIEATFYNFSGSTTCLILTAVFTVFLWLLMNTGVKAGVEKICTVAMPTLIVLLIGLAIYTNMLPGASEGLKWYLTPDFSKITPAVIQAAAVQVFFSIGIGMSCGFVYGSYIKKDANMIGDTAGVAVLDTTIATLSGLVITPALFAFGIEPTTGSSLIFITLPHMFNAMGPVVGTVFGVVFLFAIFLAGTTTVIGFLEATQANLADLLGWSRKKANLVTILIVFGLSIFSTLSTGTGIFADIKILGGSIFDFYDTISSAFGLTIGAVLMLAYVLFKWGFKNFQDAANEGAKGIRIYNWMKPYYQIFLPLALAFICYGIISVYFF